MITHRHQLLAMGEAERAEFIYGLPKEDFKDLKDGLLDTMAGFEPEEGYRYFDDAEELRDYLLEYVVPLAKPWRADDKIRHETAHAECALQVGALSVKYSVLRKGNHMGSSLFCNAYGPVELPNLAFAAIAGYPLDSNGSLVDMNYLRTAGYYSRNHLSERIQRWNELGRTPYIPMIQ